LRRQSCSTTLPCYHGTISDCQRLFIRCRGRVRPATIAHGIAGGVAL